MYSKIEIYPGVSGFKVVLYKVIAGSHAVTGYAYFTDENDLIAWLGNSDNLPA